MCLSVGHLRIIGRRRVAAAAAACAATLAATAAPGAGATAPSGAAATARGSLLVGTAPGPIGARTVPGRALAPGLRVVSPAQAPAAGLRALPGVRFVEPDLRFHASAVPNDPLYRKQQPLGRTGLLRAPAAWAGTTGGPVTVAVVDSGIDLGHPDLAENLWVNPGEIPGNGIDDDRDGFVDDVNGADLVAGDGTPEDSYGHGTQMAGIIGARGGNGRGIAGTAWQVRLMAVRVLDGNGDGSTGTVAAGIEYAVAHGARIINLSINGPGPSQAIDQAIARAKAAGAVVVASAGNDGQDLERHPSYPVSSAQDDVVGVGSVANDDALSSFSNYGPSAVDLVAPGEDVLTTSLGGGYTTEAGTSGSAAYASGVLALLASARPEASSEQLRAALLDGARPARRLGRYAAHGSLDALSALERMAPELGPRIRPAVRLTARPAAFSRPGRGALRWSARGNVDAIASFRLRAGRMRVRVPAGRADRHGWDSVLRLPAGRRRWRVAAFDARGDRLAVVASSLRVGAPRRARHRPAAGR